MSQALLLSVSGVATGLGILGEALGWPAAVTVSLFAVAILAGAVEIVPRGLEGVFKDRSLDINFLVTVAVIGAVLLGQWGEGATVVFLFSLGEYLEELTLARTRRSIQALMAMAPESAQVRLPGGHEHAVHVEDVQPGSLVIVRPGDRIPLDGTVEAGESAVDQSPITGESVPADKEVGDPVYAGTINGTGYLEVRTTRPFSQGALARIIHLVEEAQSQKAPSQRFVERFARIYTPVVVAGAVLLTAVPALVFGEPVVPWFNRSLVLLLVACPCALVISTPVTVVAAIGNASRNGVLIKGGAYLEKAGTLRAVAFDKTGTLTHGRLTVAAIHPASPISDLRLPTPASANAPAATEFQSQIQNPESKIALLRLAAALEARSEHPLAAAIVRAAHLEGAAELPAVERFQAATGNGVRGLVEGREVLVGSPQWIASQGVALDGVRETLAELAVAGQTPVVVAAGAAGPGEDARREVAGVIALADELRPSAAATVAELRRAGVRRVVLLSGDTQATALAVAAQAGIAPADVFAALLPEDKVDQVRALERAHGAVAMVGDGVNDAPALAAASVGIAMGVAGSDTALETADVALVADDLSRLPWVVRLSRSAAWTIRFNVAFALVTKLVVLALAAVGIANLWLAIAADTGASIVVILNGMRLLGKLPPAEGTDPGSLRRRYGLAEEEAHGHAHAHGHGHGRAHAHAGHGH